VARSYNSLSFAQSKTKPNSLTVFPTFTCKEQAGGRSSSVSHLP
jgi:hypothetical protein